MGPGGSRPFALALLIALASARPGPAGVAREPLHPMSGAISAPSVAVGPDGEPHLLFPEDRTEVPQHAWRERGRWRTEAVDSRFAFCGSQCIAVDSLGRVHAAYGAVDDLDWTRPSRLIHAVRDGAGWTLTDLGPSGGQEAVALGPDDRPRVLHRTTDGFARLLVLGGAGWVARETGLAAPGHRSVRYAVDRHGNDHLLLERGERLWYATNATGEWRETVVAEAPFLEGELAVDPAGRPHVVASSGLISSAEHVTHLRHDGTGWTGRPVLRDAPGRLRFPGSLQADAGGRLLAVFGDAAQGPRRFETRTLLAYFDGTEWRESGAAGPRDVAPRSSALGPDGSLHVAGAGGRLEHLRFTVADPAVEWEEVESLRLGDAIRLRGTLRVRNPGSAPSRSARVALYLSDNAVLDAGDEYVADAPRTGRIRPGRSRRIPVSVALPASAAGRGLLALVDPTRSREDLDRLNSGAVAAIGE